MRLFRIYSEETKSDPDALLHLFVAIAVVSIVVITTLAGLTFHGVLKRHVTANAEEDAIHVSKALLAQEWTRITAPTPAGGTVVMVSPRLLPEVDRQMRAFLSPFDIVKIKIYSADARIVYSTEPKLIGVLDSRNERLSNALSGEYDSKLETKEEVKDLADEVKFNVDVVETYIPIRDNGRVIGSFEVYIDVTKYRRQTMRAALMSLAILTGILLVVFGISYLLIRRGTRELKAIQEVLRKQTITDPLTGSFNKRHIDLLARREFARALRRREKGLADAELGFIMIDIDRFKGINDTLGHLAGDELLQKFAERVAASLRSYDHFGRFGGEEFLIVLPGSSLEESRAVAEKVWSLIREEPFHLEGSEAAVTASAGVAAMQAGDGDYLQVLKRADENLYRAKSGGRDRVL